MVRAAGRGGGRRRVRGQGRRAGAAHPQPSRPADRLVGAGRHRHGAGRRLARWPARPAASATARSASTPRWSRSRAGSASATAAAGRPRRSSGSCSTGLRPDRRGWWGKRLRPERGTPRARRAQGADGRGGRPGGGQAHDLPPGAGAPRALRRGVARGRPARRVGPRRHARRVARRGAGAAGRPHRGHRPEAAGAGPARWPARLVIDLARQGPPRRRGVGKLRRAAARRRGADLDVDAVHRGAWPWPGPTGSAPDPEELRVRGWSRPGTALCLVVDRSGSMGGERAGHRGGGGGGRGVARARRLQRAGVRPRRGGGQGPGRLPATRAGGAGPADVAGLRHHRRGAGPADGGGAAGPVAGGPPADRAAVGLPGHGAGRRGRCGRARSTSW